MNYIHLLIDLEYCSLVNNQMRIWGLFISSFRKYLLIFFNWFFLDIILVVIFCVLVWIVFLETVTAIFKLRIKSGRKGNLLLMIDKMIYSICIFMFQLNISFLRNTAVWSAPLQLIILRSEWVWLLLLKIDYLRKCSCSGRCCSLVLNMIRRIVWHQNSGCETLRESIWIRFWIISDVNYCSRGYTSTALFSVAGESFPPALEGAGLDLGPSDFIFPD